MTHHLTTIFSFWVVFAVLLDLLFSIFFQPFYDLHAILYYLVMLLFVGIHIFHSPLLVLLSLLLKLLHLLSFSLFFFGLNVAVLILDMPYVLRLLTFLLFLLSPDVSLPGLIISPTGFLQYCIIYCQICNYFF